VKLIHHRNQLWLLQCARLELAKNQAISRAKFVTQQQALSIGYADNNGAVAHRIVDPIKISAGALVARDHATGEMQSFRIPRITGVAPL